MKTPMAQASVLVVDYCLSTPNIALLLMLELDLANISPLPVDITVEIERRKAILSQALACVFLVYCCWKWLACHRIPRGSHCGACSFQPMVPSPQPQPTHTPVRVSCWSVLVHSSLPTSLSLGSQRPFPPSVGYSLTFSKDIWIPALSEELPSKCVPSLGIISQG